ncbi:ArsR/SmtB family transcription factor [Robinsoniella peoriensis]
MRYLKDIDSGLPLFKALGSDIRIAILNLLLDEGPMNMNELAARVNITNGALTSHIKKLEDCGLVNITSEGDGHGNQKVCQAHIGQILFSLTQEPVIRNESTAELKVGQYCDFSVYPTCGISTRTSLIGDVDDPRFFVHQQRFDADILWLGKGYVEYILPNVLPASQRIEEIDISLEISSEAPGSNSIWPSDIHFYINETFVGLWTSPGDYADRPGHFTPSWWFSNWNQYGLLKNLVINKNGTFMNDLKISDVTIEDFAFTDRDIIRFKLGVPDNARHVGGMTIFGSSFGDYNQDIRFKIRYSPLKENERTS